MKALNYLSTTVVCLIVSACGGPDRDRSLTERSSSASATAQVESEKPSGRPEPITVTGCLSSADGRYVLTELAPNQGAGGPAQATTETYQLTDADEQLRQHVGKQVRISGEAEPARIADVRESTPATPPTAGTAGQQTENRAAVSTETLTRLEMRHMSVKSVMPTGEDCPAGTASSR
jgi:hypothetical protein